MVKRTIEKINSDNLWETIVKNYEFIKDAHMSNSFIILMALSGSKEPLSTTQISENIAINSQDKLFKVSGALKDSLENRLRKAGYVDGTIFQMTKKIENPLE
jgi:hypothetical protein